MQFNSEIYFAGHRGMVEIVIVKDLLNKGFNNIITRTLSELNLINQNDVSDFLSPKNQNMFF
ncbi:hypothetical protein [Flavobacterium sp.]|uniref:hypothetical protein n=1 Tax=Flavobacterium sp. TaxID=239 RepID=UPI00286B94F6|nr:hypothetical protein [Flavobacterium sp.]